MTEWEIEHDTRAFDGADAVSAQQKDRSHIPLHHTWNLAEIFRDEESWKEVKLALLTELPAIDRYRGRLAESALMLLD